jgi:putative acetyltransferase
MGIVPMAESSFQIGEMTAEDYDEVLTLWQNTEGIGLDEGTDTREGTIIYLLRNSGLSFVARLDGRVAGAVLCGHDGRRGYLHHLAVDLACRHRDIGRALVETCLRKLGSLGIRKCNIFLFSDNDAGEDFWRHVGWKERADLKVLQKMTQCENHGIEPDQ